MKYRKILFLLCAMVFSLFMVSHSVVTVHAQEYEYTTGETEWLTNNGAGYYPGILDSDGYNSQYQPPLWAYDSSQYYHSNYRPLDPLYTPYNFEQSLFSQLGDQAYIRDMSGNRVNANGWYLPKSDTSPDGQQVRSWYNDPKYVLGIWNYRSGGWISGDYGGDYSGGMINHYQATATYRYQRPIPSLVSGPQMLNDDGSPAYCSGGTYWYKQGSIVRIPVRFQDSEGQIRNVRMTALNPTYLGFSIVYNIQTAQTSAQLASGYFSGYSASATGSATDATVTFRTRATKESVYNIYVQADNRAGACWQASEDTANATYGFGQMWFCVDGTAPTVPEIYSDGYQNNWVNRNVKIVLGTSKDLQQDGSYGSGVNRYEYNLDNTGWKTYSGSFQVTSEGWHTVQSRAIDNVGNVSGTYTYSFGVDKTAPSLQSSSITGAQYQTGSTYWVKPGTTLTSYTNNYDALSQVNQTYLRVAASDGSSDNRRSLSWVNGSTSEYQTSSFLSITKGWENTKSSNTVQSGWSINMSSSAEKDYSIQNAGSDNAGNLSSFSTFGTIKVDSTAPYGNTPTVSNITKTGYDVTITGVGDARSGVNNVSFTTWTQQDGQHKAVKTNGTYQGNGTWTCHVNVSDHSNELDNYYTQATIVDHVGNTTTKQINVPTLDNDLKITINMPNDDYFTGEDIITSVTVYNKNMDITPAMNCVVHFSIPGITDQTKQLVVPANQKQTLWFRWSSGNTPKTIHATAVVDPGNVIPDQERNNNISILTTPIISPWTSTVNEDDGTLNKPSSYSFTNPPSIFSINSNSANASIWEEWSYVNGSFELNTYKASISSALTVGMDPHDFSCSTTPDPVTGLYTMKSGYGFSESVSTDAQSNDPDASSITGAQFGCSLYPEFGYDRSIYTVFDRLTSGLQSSFRLSANKYAFYSDNKYEHFTPFWFPDSDSIYGYEPYQPVSWVMHCWTPGGSLSSVSYTGINIKDCALNDWYTRQVK